MRNSSKDPNPRRKFLKAAALTTFLPLSRMVGATELTGRDVFLKQTDPLRIPHLLTGVAEAGAINYDLELLNGVTEFKKGIQTVTRGINGSFLGPTLRMRSGEDVRLNVTNNIGETSTLHWHGFHLPASQDGGPHQTIDDGASRTSAFTVKQKAGTFWYHSHQIQKTAEHVWQGLAGLIIVEDEEGDGLSLPQNYGVDDIPIVLQDRRFSSDGQMDYRPSRHDRMMGMIGNTPMVNGTLAPHFDATTKLLRLRVLNGSNGSMYNVGFDDERAFHQIASDGGLLEKPVETTRVWLAPGERAEILVDISDGGSTVLNSKAGTPSGGSSRMGRGMGSMMENMQAQNFDFLEIRPAGALSGNSEIPGSLVSIDRLDPEDAAVTRRFTMEVLMGPAMMSGDANTHTINELAMDMDRIDARINVGDTEIWEIDNPSMMAHPFHVHDVQFQILDRNGEQPAPAERGLKDTVLVNPGETVRIIARFDDYPDPDNPYMFHCHILEHEDMGMMGQFVIV